MKRWRRTSHSLARLVTLAACLSAVMVGQNGLEKERLLGITINGKQISESEAVLELEPGKYYVPESIFLKGRLRLPPVHPTRVPALGVDYYPLDAIPSVRVAMDSDHQVLDISVTGAAFLDTRVDALDRPRVTASRPEPGLFLNHDFRLLTGPAQRTLTGLVEGGMFSSLGVFTTQYAGRDLTNHVTPLRLNSQFFRDFPERMTTLTIGDTISADAAWARRIYYAGVSFGTKFATQPSFISTALPSLSGQADQPSTVDIYVNNVRQMSQHVDAGPFSIQNIPVISSQGDIRMVVTDVLGRQQVISESFIHATQLLRQGVSQFTYEAGSPRLNFGLESNSYRSVFGAATGRRGITDSLTLEGRAEIQPGPETVGIGEIYALRRVGLFSSGIAGSLDHGRSGQLWYAQFNRSAPGYGMGVQVQRSTDDFRQVGLLAQQQAAKMLLQGEVSKSLGNHGTITAGYLRRDGRTEPDVRAVTASFSLRAGRAVLSAGGTYSLLKPRQYGLDLALIVPLGERKIAVASSEMAASGNTASVEISQQLPLGPGYGYRVRETALSQERTDAGFYLQNMQGTYGIEGSEAGGQTGFQLSERGALVFLHKHVLLSPWLNDSFGVIEVEHEKGVPVYINNQLLAKTGRSGLALVPWLVPYNQNSVHLDDSALPVDVNLDLQDRTIVPMPRSGFFLKYKPQSIGGASLVLVTESGDPVPQEATVTLKGKPQTYQVALRGEVFISDIDYPAVVQVEWEGNKCAVRIEKPPANTLVPKIGPVVCKAEH